MVLQNISGRFKDSLKWIARMVSGGSVDYPLTMSMMKNTQEWEIIRIRALILRITDFEFQGQH